ncbi:spermidine/putrescine ABC transporter permease [Acetobacter okinawensis]|uniref:spermidine/putrescine ABC transporter permease n=1 Tax=Acetobacter okinawensis TaxID=1076594 RepID=UPI001BA909C7|nr:spermidine/putrescine ABC transporter permease [Acetobacter okinawensis]
MDAAHMIPYLALGAPAHTAWVCGIVMLATSLLVTAAFVILVFALRAEQHLYTLTLALLLPCTGVCMALPAFVHAATTPILQGFLLSPLLLLPLSLPIKTLQRSWIATAQELGANKLARLYFFWWPLLKKPLVLTLSLATLFSIVQ